MILIIYHNINIVDYKVSRVTSTQGKYNSSPAPVAGTPGFVSCTRPPARSGQL